MIIERVEIENIYGIEKLSFSPGVCAIVRGDNGEGKTSLIGALRTPFEGGVRPERLRIGAEKGFVKFTLDTGDTVEFRAWIKKKRDGTKEHAQVVEYITKDGVTLPSAATLVKELGDALAVDPAKLLAHDVTTAAGRKALTQAILDVMPFTVDANDLASVIRKVNDSDEPQPNEPEAQRIAASVLPAPVDLGGLRKARQALEETRRKVGVEARQAESTVQELRKGVASEEQAGDTEQQLAQAQKDLATLKKTIFDEQAAGREEAAQERIKAEQEYQRKLRTIDKAERDFLDTVEQEHAPRERELTEQITLLRQKAASIQQAAGARKKLAELEEIGKQKNHEYDLFSRALGMLDEIKDAKLANSPIPELAVESEDITVDLVPWQVVNTARRIQIVVKLCVLRKGKLQFLVLEGAELSETTWAELKQALIEAGFQIVVTFVKAKSPLTIEVEDAVAA